MENPIRKLLKHKLIVALCGLVVFVNTSCNNGEIYYQYHELKEGKWAKRDVLSFDIDSTSFELNKPYHLYVEVTNNINYPYQNIWFFVESNIESDTTFIKTSKEHLLADEFGKWKGSGFGSLYQSSFFYDKVVFRKKQNYKIKLGQGMRDEPLRGIEKVGIRLTKLE